MTTLFALFRSSSLTILILIGGSSGCVRFGDGSSNGHLQDVRSKVMQAFLDDRDAAVKKYRLILDGRSSISGERSETAELTVASGQLLRYDSANASRYLAIIDPVLNNPDPSLRSVAVAALAYDSGERSLLKLFSEINAKDELVRMEALSALKYRYASPAENETRGMSFMARRATEFCGTNPARTTAEAAEFCEFVSQRKGL